MRVFQYIIKICAIYSFTLLKFTVGNHPLEGLHKAAAQSDRARIMHIMRVSIINTCTTCIHSLVFETVENIY